MTTDIGLKVGRISLASGLISGALTAIAASNGADERYFLPLIGAFGLSVLGFFGGYGYSYYQDRKKQNGNRR